MNAGDIIHVLVQVLIFLMASASIAVGWHRFGLLGEQPSLVHLRFGRIEALFVLKSLLLGFLFWFVFLLIFLLVSLLGSPIILMVVGVLAAIFAIPTFMRMSLILPATAVGQPLGLGESYVKSEGLGWRMFFANVFLSVPFAILMFLLAFGTFQLTESLPGFFILMKLLILWGLGQVIITVLGISVLTAGYRIMMENNSSAHN
ncbi:hypothetical protein [Roseibium sp. RKSG952]|uniref:hypothetical protein n=1 Tax=Roseibium sp. RKSG952 TaxID=2529384 RepID=UPI0012BBB54A|nr:hypothetical protein [Roseibium sp. RKSG952]MTH97821.1 hypothetical protein [Roseibium sp. RKSG952]